MREQNSLPRGCHLPPPKPHRETSHGAIMAGDTCKAPGGQDGGGGWGGENDTSGFPIFSICFKDHWLFPWPLCWELLVVFAGGLVCGKAWAPTYHCPLLADGHEHIPSPLSSPCVFWVLMPLEEGRCLGQESGGAGPRPACLKQWPRAVSGCAALKSHPVFLECVSDTLGFKDLLGKK